MGKKKVTSPQDNYALKIRKKNHRGSNNNNQKQLNSLINVLRPKVYITDSSNFKQLVQELTGNGNGSISSGTTIPFPDCPAGRTEGAAEIKVINIIIEDDGDEAWPEIEPCSFDALVDSIEGFREEDKQMHLNEIKFDDIWSMNQLGDEDWLAYQDLESWLLDVDQPCPSSFYGFGQNQEASIYDYYELSALI